MEEPLEPEVPTAQANEARVAYLASHGISVPVDQMYATSLLEALFLASGGPAALEKARSYHEARIAPILDAAVARLTVVEERRSSAEARSILLNGTRPR